MNKSKLLQELDYSYNDHELYDCLTVCSNQLIETVNILKTSAGWVPLTIRKGDSPRVWLSAPVELDVNNNPIKYLDLIVNSEVKHDGVSFINSVHGFQIKIHNTVVVEAGNHDGKNLEIIKMDLTPIGLSHIKGDIHGLSVGGMKMSRSGVKGSDTFIGL
ncbi:hypothetical protein ACWONU_000441 [Vibrio parahaemolyticus]